MFPRMLPALAAVLILPATAQAASTRFVAKGGSDASTCTDSAHPCLTIGHAVSSAATGDTINIGAGTFSESVNAAGKVLTFNGAGPDATTGTVVNGHGSGSAFILTNGGTLHNLRATEDSAATVAVGSAGGSQQLTVTNAVIIADGFQSAIDAETAGGSLAVTISDSTLQQVQTSSGGAEYGLLMQGAISAGLTRVTASSVQNDGVAGGLGVNISATDSTFTGTTGLADNNAILQLYRCRITGTMDEGIYMSAGSGAGTDMHATIEDSLLQGVTFALDAHANTLGKASTATLHDSTLVASGPGTVDGVFTDAFNNATSSVTLDGSVVRVQSTTGGTARDLHADETAATISASYSAFTTSVATVGATVPAPGSGSNISGDPLFTNPAGGDYSLQQSSPLIDKGDQAGLAAGEKDVTGGTRVLDGNGDGTAIVDIGAFEHTYVAPPPTGGGGGGTTTTPPPATDTTAPAITNVKVRNGKLRFTLSEAAKVTVTITKGKKHKRVRRFTVTGKAGADVATFKKLAPGTYRITLRAVDAAGNHSKSFSRSFKVKRRRA